MSSRRTPISHPHPISLIAPSPVGSQGPFDHCRDSSRPPLDQNLENCRKPSCQTVGAKNDRHGPFQFGCWGWDEAGTRGGGWWWWGDECGRRWGKGRAQIDLDVVLFLLEVLPVMSHRRAQRMCRPNKMATPSGEVISGGHLQSWLKWWERHRWSDSIPPPSSPFLVSCFGCWLKLLQMCGLCKPYWMLFRVKANWVTSVQFWRGGRVFVCFCFCMVMSVWLSLGAGDGIAMTMWIRDI